MSQKSWPDGRFESGVLYARLFETRRAHTTAIARSEVGIATTFCASSPKAFLISDQTDCYLVYTKRITISNQRFRIQTNLDYSKFFPGKYASCMAIAGHAEIPFSKKLDLLIRRDMLSESEVNVLCSDLVSNKAIKDAVFAARTKKDWQKIARMSYEVDKTDILLRLLCSQYDPYLKLKDMLYELNSLALLLRYYESYKHYACGDKYRP